MNTDSLKETLKQAAVEFAKVEAEYYKAKEKFDRVFDKVVNGNNGSANEEVLHLDGNDGIRSKPVTQQVLAVLPADGRPMSIKQISAMVGKSPKVISATCSNLKDGHKVERAGYGLWRLKQQ